MSEPIYSISTTQLRQYAAAHSATEQQVSAWANDGRSFPQEFLRTHGIAFYPTYLKLVEFYIAKRAAGMSLAQANAATALALNTNVKDAEDVEQRNVAMFRTK